MTNKIVLITYESHLQEARAYSLETLEHIASTPTIEIQIIEFVSDEYQIVKKETTTTEG